MTRVAILQPSYLPWLGYFEMLYNSDVFVFYDDVQYDKNGWRNRNRIRGNGKGGWVWLTVPVKTAGRFGQNLQRTEVDNSTDWALKHLRTFAMSYARAPGTIALTEKLRVVLKQQWTSLVDLDIATIRLMCSILGPGEARMAWSSSLGIEAGEKSERLLKICQHFGADTYYATRASKEYLNVGLFSKNGVTVEFQDYQHPTYPQIQGGPFVSHLSILDLMANCGNLSLEVLRGVHPA